MVSSVSSTAGLSTAMLSGSQCRGPRDTQAQQENLFSKLDVNGDGGIDQSELTQFLDFAASSTSGTNAATDTSSAGADLFKSLDTNGDGTISKTEMSDGAKKLFQELRSQLMSGNAASATAQSTDATQNPPAPQGPPSGGGHHHGRGLFAKIESLIDQYRSTGTDSAATTETSTLSVAA